MFLPCPTLLNNPPLSKQFLHLNNPLLNPLVSTTSQLTHHYNETNLGNSGLTSVIRNYSVTQTLTIPSPTTWSSTKRFHRSYAITIDNLCPYSQIFSLIHLPLTSLFSLDSDLEAFSHYPSDGSVAPLATQPRAKPIIRTNSSSRTTLDYCHNVPPSVG